MPAAKHIRAGRYERKVTYNFGLCALRLSGLVKQLLAQHFAHPASARALLGSSLILEWSQHGQNFVQKMTVTLVFVTSYI